MATDPTDIQNGTVYWIDGTDEEGSHPSRDLGVVVLRHNSSSEYAVCDREPSQEPQFVVRAFNDQQAAELGALLLASVDASQVDFDELQRLLRLYGFNDATFDHEEAIGFPEDKTPSTIICSNHGRETP